MRVRDVVLDSMHRPVVLLESLDGAQGLQIWIGESEALSIYQTLRKDAPPPPRPMTHDLIRNLLKGVHARVDRVVVSDLRDNTYYAFIGVRTARGGRVDVDSRPSDAIAIALKEAAPIFVARDLTSPSRPAPGEALQGAEVPPSERDRGRGYAVQELNEALRDALEVGDEPGLLVAEVTEGGPASRAGLRPGDVVFAFGGRPLDTLARFREAVRDSSPEDLRVRRDHREIEIRIP